MMKMLDFSILAWHLWWSIPYHEDSFVTLLYASWLMLPSTFTVFKHDCYPNAHWYSILWNAFRTCIWGLSVSFGPVGQCGEHCGTWCFCAAGSCHSYSCWCYHSALPVWCSHCLHCKPSSLHNIWQISYRNWQVSCCSGNLHWSGQYQFNTICVGTHLSGWAVLYLWHSHHNNIKSSKLAASKGRRKISGSNSNLGCMCIRSIKTMKGQVTQALVKSLQLGRNETVIDIDGTATTQPVLQHIGVSTWPGELDHLSWVVIFCRIWKISSGNLLSAMVWYVIATVCWLDFLWQQNWYSGVYGQDGWHWQTMHFILKLQELCPMTGQRSLIYQLI